MSIRGCRERTAFTAALREERRDAFGLNMQDGPEQVAATGLQLKILATEFGTQANRFSGDPGDQATKPGAAMGRQSEDSCNQTPEDGGPVQQVPSG